MAPANTVEKVIHGQRVQVTLCPPGVAAGAFSWGGYVPTGIQFDIAKQERRRVRDGKTQLMFSFSFLALRAHNDHG